MTTCVRCHRERPIRNRKRGLCGPCASSLSNRGQLAQWPPLLPPLARQPRPNKRAHLGAALRREIARLYALGYASGPLACAFDTSANAVIEAVHWAERHAQ